MSFKPRQVTFGGGEFAPSMWGRSDLEKYAGGARTIKNFFVGQHGSLISRPGTEYVAKVRQFTEPARIFGFVFSDDVSVLVVFSHLYYTIYLCQEGALPTEVEHNGSPWSYTALPYIRCCQTGDVITITCKDNPVYELKRLSANCETWSLAKLSFDVPSFPAYGGLPMLSNGLSAPAIGTADDSHPGMVWQWRITRIIKDAAGRYYETQPFSVENEVIYQIDFWQKNVTYGATGGTSPHWCIVKGRDTYVYWATKSSLHHEPPLGGDNYWKEYTNINDPDVPTSFVNVDDAPGSLPCYADMPVVIDWRVLPQRPGITKASSDPSIVATRIYRGRDGHFGFVGETTADTFSDDGASPDFSTPPPVGTNPFKIYDDAGILVREEYPQICGFHEGRRILAATTERPEMMWASAVESYNDFDEVVPAKDSDSLSFEFASRQLERITAVVARDVLLALTTSGEWTVTGAGAEVISPNSISAHETTKYGNRDIEPIECGDYVWILQRKGCLPWVLLYSHESGGYIGMDVSTLSSHLFHGHTIVDWAFIQHPHPILWAVRDDGILLSCTFSKEQQLTAWARHEFCGGTVEAVACVPEGDADSLYMVVQRGAYRLIERMSPRIFEDVRDANCLDCAVVADGRTDGTGSGISFSVVATGVDDVLTITGHTFTTGSVIRIWGENGECCTFKVTGATAGVVLDGLPDTLSGVSMTAWDVCIESITPAPVFLTGLEGDGIATELWMVIDGDVSGPYPYTAQPIALPRPGGVVSCGVGYNCDFESLDIPQETTRRKIVSHVAVETIGSRGGSVGVALDDDDLEEVPVRQVSHGYGYVPLQRDQSRVPVPAQWAEQGKVAYRQSAPLPIEILGITREVEFGG